MILGHICFKCAHEGKVCVTRENPIVSTPSCGEGDFVPVRDEEFVFVSR